MSWPNERTPQNVARWETHIEFMCPLCQGRGWPEQYGSGPKCAFEDSEVFIGNNWACATMLRLRELATKYGHYGFDDQNYYILPVELPRGSGVIFMSVYKSRGQTENAYFLPSGDNPEIGPLTLTVATQALEMFSGVK